MSDLDVDTVEPEVPEKKQGVFRQIYNCTNDFNFIKTFRWGLIIGAAICVLSIVSLFTRGLNLGIDFEGGSKISFATTQPVALEDVRAQAERCLLYTSPSPRDS